MKRRSESIVMVQSFPFDVKNHGRAWFSRTRFHVLSDIARQLWATPRAIGNSKMNVLQHSVLVYDLVRTDSRQTNRLVELAALVHDIPEIVTGDIPSPVKVRLGPNIRKMENAILDEFLTSCGSSLRHDCEEFAIVKEYDRLAWEIERRYAFHYVNSAHFEFQFHKPFASQFVELLQTRIQ